MCSFEIWQIMLTIQATFHSILAMEEQYSDRIMISLCEIKNYDTFGLLLKKRAKQQKIYTTKADPPPLLTFPNKERIVANFAQIRLFCSIC